MTEITLGYDYEKLLSNLRGHYQGRRWYKALTALDKARSIHTGSRKNGEPEFSHQVFQAQFLRTLEDQAVDPEGTHITILFHDTCEDYDYPLVLIEKAYGTEIGESVYRMDKHGDFASVEPQNYYSRIADDVRSSIAKGIDRIHNIQSMVGVFTREKQVRYIAETRDLVLPMLKQARKNFPQQEPIYQNIKHVLITQIDLIEKIHEAGPQ